MKQDMREISYNIKRETEDKNLIYTIDYLLYNEILDRFSGYNTEMHRNVNAMCYQVLEDKDGIRDSVMEKVLEDYYHIDDLKINYLIDTEFMKMFNKAKRYFIETNKMIKVKEDEELITRLNLHFNYIFNNCNNTDVKSILNAMSTQTFKNATVEDLKIDLSLDRYKDFDKIYNKTLNNFKKLHINMVLEDKKEQKKQKIGFGWKMYAVIKGIEALFKL